MKVSKEFIPYLNITGARPGETQLEGKPDQGMLREKGGMGFPYCIFMDASGEVLSELRPMEETSFREGMKPISLLLSARKTAKDATKSRDKKLAKQNLALIEAVFEPNEDHFAELNKIAKKKKIDEDIRDLYIAMVETWPIRKAVEERDAGLKDAGPDPDKQRLVASAFEAKMLEMYRKKVRIEKASQPHFDDFWIGVANGSVTAKDKKTGLLAVETLEKKYSDNDGAMRYLAGIREKLEAL